MRSVLRLAVASLCVCALAACGGDGTRTANAYVDRLNAVNERFAATAGRLRSAITPTSATARDRATLAHYGKAVDQVVAELRAIQPPAEVRALHGRYVDVMAAYADAVQTAVDDIRAANAPGQAQAAGRRLRTASERVDADVNAAIAAINQALQG